MLLYDWLMMVLLVYFLDMVWFQVYGGGGGGVSAILGNGYEIQGQNCIALQGCREGYCEYGSATRILRWVYGVLGESNLTRLSGLMGSKADSRIGDALSFPRRVDFSILSCDDVLK